MGDMPQKIGKYEIRASLGEGGTGVVYEGFDPDIQRRVAIKSLHPHLISGKVGEELLTRFKREAVSAAKCIHPNVVSILEYGEDGDRPFIIMEYVDGVSLHRLIKHRLKHGRGISLRRSLSIISQLLKALHTAHGLYIIHRDVKASNILLVNKSGKIKLADFGMARITENSDLTMIGSFMGTPRYMAPELRLGLEADSRADVFSAARLFLELLKMMPESTLVHCSHLTEIVNMPPGNRIDYSALYPTALIPVVTKGLQVDRKKRYQTVLEFMHDIKQALPMLEQKSSTPAERLAPLKQKSAREFVPSEDELDSMTTLLADFIGPVAKFIMEEHETKSTSANNLAAEISKEIPEQEKQAEFLRRWNMMSVSRRTLINKKRSDVPPEITGPQPLPGQVQNKTGHDLVHYIGTIAKSFLRH